MGINPNKPTENLSYGNFQEPSKPKAGIINKVKNFIFDLFVKIPLIAKATQFLNEAVLGLHGYFFKAAEYQDKSNNTAEKIKSVFGLIFELAKSGRNSPLILELKAKHLMNMLPLLDKKPIEITEPLATTLKRDISSELKKMESSIPLLKSKNQRSEEKLKRYEKELSSPKGPYKADRIRQAKKYIQLLKSNISERTKEISALEDVIRNPSEIHKLPYKLQKHLSLNEGKLQQIGKDLTRNFVEIVLGDFVINPRFDETIKKLKEEYEIGKYLLKRVMSYLDQKNPGMHEKNEEKALNILYLATQGTLASWVGPIKQPAEKTLESISKQYHMSDEISCIQMTGTTTEVPEQYSTKSFEEQVKLLYYVKINPDKESVDLSMLNRSVFSIEGVGLMSVLSPISASLKILKDQVKMAIQSSGPDYKSISIES